MGNRQSTSSGNVAQLFDEGIKIYQTIKQEYEHQNEQQNQPHHEPVFSTEPSGDNAEYTRLRSHARDEAQKRNELFERSKIAYNNGNGAEAKELSTKGHEHDDRMKSYNKQAAEVIFTEKNHGRPPTEIDLHGLFVSEATEKVEEAMKRCQKEKRDHLVIIVGKGLHSPDHIAKLKPAILELMERFSVRCTPNKPNPGCLYVEFGKGKGDMSWFDRLTGRPGSSNDPCVVM